MSLFARRLIPQLVVVVPTVLASLVLSQRGVPPLRRLITSASLGIILIAIMTAWRLTRGARSDRQ
jgi:hypothetical protein